MHGGRGGARGLGIRAALAFELVYNAVNAVKNGWVRGLQGGALRGRKGNETVNTQLLGAASGVGGYVCVCIYIYIYIYI